MEKNLVKSILVIFVFIFLSKLSFGASENGNIIIAFRNDDISAISNPEFEYKVIKIFQKYDIKPLYAVIPKSANLMFSTNTAMVDSMISWQKKGWIDIAMHGYNHLKNRFGAGEFRALPMDEQSEKIEKANIELIKSLGIKVNYFCPPWNQIDQNTQIVLRDNNIDVISSFLGEPKEEGLKYINCNCNLFGGTLGSFIDLLELNKDNNNSVLLVPLFHTNYDFNNTSLDQLDSLLNLVVNNDKVQIVSFEQLRINQEYEGLLEKVNEAGYKVKTLRYNKYIRKIILNTPIINEFVAKYIKKANTMYNIGNYEEVINIYIRIKRLLFTVISFILVFISGIFFVLYSKMKKNG